MSIKEVWRKNFSWEIQRFDSVMYNYPYVAFDTEFTGFWHVTPRNSSEHQLYEDLKYNIDRMSLTQIAFTLLDGNGNTGGTWQFNFRKSPGISFKKNQHGGEGVDMNIFATKLKSIVRSHDGIQWITFHGLYDMAYMVKLVTNGPLPNSSLEFSKSIANVLGRVYDLKCMARYCEGLQGGEIGLQKMVNNLGVRRLGLAHQAGSDSFLTARLFVKLKEVYALDEEWYVGYLYGICAKIERTKLVTVHPSLHYFQPFSRCSSSAYSICGAFNQLCI
ncbi:putative CCR4-associated factor 1 homolog 8 [Cornus florida]|uniref:putative CCR4-associated factor 1 homolog 8 n=1 Tax=Cornus florida TaxID=4283 RepID=UPI00289DD5CE|nr:putative CCR4-associated factor 1 homolog 8 [Cornus florida]